MTKPIFKKQYERMIQAMNLEGLEIPTTLVKFYRHSEALPSELMEYHPDEITLTSCQAARQASLGDAVCLTRKNIGCIAAAISLGLVDQWESEPLEGARVYTELMRQQDKTVSQFQPPTPKDFTEGTVYACKDAHRPDFCLFGEQDSGRYRDVATAGKAVQEMMAIQPPIMQALFFCSVHFEEIDIQPDVVLLDLRPVELTRLIQAYQYNTGKRIEASMGGLRVVNSDLIVRPYLTGRINVSTYCLGARLIAQYDANRLGMGIPYALFEQIVQGMEDSRTGFPFHLYPGAAES